MNALEATLGWAADVYYIYRRGFELRTRRQFYAGCGKTMAPEMSDAARPALLSASLRQPRRLARRAMFLDVVVADLLLFREA